MADSAAQEAALIADTLRRAHLANGMRGRRWPSWSGRPPRRCRCCAGHWLSAGVPVAVAGDDLPLADEPGTRPLLMVLRCALRPAALDEQTAAELLCGPLGDTDALGLRGLRRALQLLAAQVPAHGGAGHDRGGDLLASALLDPRELIGVPDSVAGPAGGWRTCSR